MALFSALEKATTVKATETEAFLMDAAFSVAWLAGWIEPPKSRLSPELHYILTPEARKEYANSDPPPTVMLGGIEVPETFHDQFVSLFWQNQPDRIAQLEASINDFDPDFDPIEDLKASIAKARRTHSHAATPSSEPQPTNKTNPALLLIAAKQALGVSWDKFAVMATRHLRELEGREIKEGTIASRTKVDVTRDDVFRLLRGQNVRPVTVKAIAMLLRAEPDTSQLRPGGWHWQDFVWPQESHQKGRPAKGKSKKK